MLLCDIPDSLSAAVVALGQSGGHAVEEEGDGPVEHFDEERELLQDSRVNVPRKTARVRGLDAVASKDGTVFGRERIGPDRVVGLVGDAG